MSNNPEDILQNPEQIKQLIGILSSLLPKDNDETTASTDVDKIKTKSTKKPRQPKQTSATNTSRKFKKDTAKHTNQFINMPESQMYREDPNIAKKLYQQPPMKRRSKKNNINVTCRICGKRETISPSLLYGDADRYKCNKCCSNAG